MTYDGCNRCLIHLNVRTVIRVRYSDAKGQHFLLAESTDPQYLILWYNGYAQKNGVEFEIDANRGNFIPITTWYGDPICIVHLWEVREQEIRYAWKR